MKLFIVSVNSSSSNSSQNEGTEDICTDVILKSASLVSVVSNGACDEWQSEWQVDCFRLGNSVIPEVEDDQCGKNQMADLSRAYGADDSPFMKIVKTTLSTLRFR